jgi:hypothetical protein
MNSKGVRTRHRIRDDGFRTEDPSAREAFERKSWPTKTPITVEVVRILKQNMCLRRSATR